MSRTNGLKILAAPGAALILMGVGCAFRLAGPARAQTWVTVATAPYSPSDKRMVAYQIDVESIFRKDGYTYARAKFNYNKDSEVVCAKCSDSMLKIGADSVYPPPYWIKLVGDKWYAEDGRPFFDKYDDWPVRVLWSGVLRFLCDR